MITCKICNQIINGPTINGMHLKKHSITGAEYKIMFGEHSLSNGMPQETKDKIAAKTAGRKPSNLGKKTSEETKEKISDSKKGTKAWNKGIPRTEDEKQKISESKIGTKAWNKGIPLTEEHKDKLRELALLRPSPMLGRTLSNDTKEKIRRKLTGRTLSLEHAEKSKNALRKIIRHKGVYKTSAATKKKISITSLNAWKHKRIELQKNLLSKITKLNLTLLNNIDDPFLEFSCNVCSHKFARTAQMFDACRLREDFCPGCYPRIVYKSNMELELFDYIKSLGLEVHSGVRHIINPLELDIYIPSKNIAIEFCGLFWHSEKQGKTKNYHKNKYTLCKNKNIDLITIFEDEWVARPDVVKSIINSKLGIISNKIFARKCTVKEISSTISIPFLNAYHLQGGGKSSKKYGLYYKNKLVSVMTFSNSNLSRKSIDWDINRFCTQPNTIVVGGASKLFTAFLKDINPPKVISFADLRYGTGQVYQNLGFTHLYESEPNYWYINGQKRLHRFTLRKNKNDDPDKTEWGNRLDQGWDRIWDCGHNKWEFTASK